MTYLHFVAKASWSNVEKSDDAPILSKYDGIDSQENFVDYLNGREQRKLVNKLAWGYATFRYSRHGLLIVTTYEELEELQNDEVELLQKYTVGQWSDGIGENFEQQEIGDVYLSMWFPGQKVVWFRTDGAELSKEFLLTNVLL